MRFQISENIRFAKFHEINSNTNYSVTPHHSGIYPVIPDLFDLWENEFYIRAASTSSYPDTQPLYFRRGFIYKSVHVAPRQPSFMYTSTFKFDSEDTDFDYWINLSRGGSLFDLFLYNQVNILMTHIPNYSHERLAIFLFRNVFEFLTCWTNLKFYSLPPLEIVKKYFELHPQEKEPLWTVSKLKLIFGAF
jgi:heparan sulfate N-deacetylase/N-sulfotransferase NDST2